LSILDNITTGKESGRPRLTVIHGGPGVGKTTWASHWEKPLIIQTEEGSEDLDVSRTPLITSYGEVIQAVSDLIKEEELPFSTIVVDSADWIEPMIDRDLKSEHFDTDYGKGAIETGLRFKRVIDGLQLLRKKHRVNIVVIAHSQLRSINSPEGGSYDQWAPKLSKRANAILVEAADEILYCTQETIIRTEKGSFGNDRGVAVGTGRRVIKLKPSPAYVSKHRLGREVPSEISMDNVEDYLTLLP